MNEEQTEVEYSIFEVLPSLTQRDTCYGPCRTRKVFAQIFLTYSDSIFLSLTSSVVVRVPLPGYS